MAAASTPAAWAATLRTNGKSDARKKQSSSKVSTSSGSERQLSGKSGKSTKALGLATYEDYKWFVGDYTVKDPDTLVNLRGGESYFNPTIKGTRLEVNNVLDADNSPSLIFEAAFYYSWTNIVGDQIFAKEVYDGTASYNTDFANQVTLYSDHVELLVDGVWTAIPNSSTSEVGHFTCSKLSNVPSGKSIVCDTYTNDYYDTLDSEEPVSFETMSTAVWTDITTTDED